MNISGSNKVLYQECKKLYRKILLEKYGHKCLRCSKTYQLQVSHIYPVGKTRKLELDLENAVILCISCHFWFFHKNPLEAAEWLKQTLPKEQLERLALRKGQTGEGSQDFKLIKIYLEQELKKLKLKTPSN